MSTMRLVAAPLGLLLALVIAVLAVPQVVNMEAVIGGVITLVIGMVLASTVNTQAASTGAAANIGSFTGAQALNDLIPLVYIAAIVMVGVGLIGMGGAGYMGVGPMGRGRG
jgi:ABC-type transporter Mla maintaining outer membrane lipid asymmetry permease subunit MlaE